MQLSLVAVGREKSQLESLCVQEPRVFPQKFHAFSQLNKNCEKDLS